MSEYRDISSRVQIHSDRLVVLDWNTDDPDVVAFFRPNAPEHLARAFERALKVGVVTSNAVGTVERIDYIQKEFDCLQTRFAEHLNNALGQVSETVDDVFGEKGKFGALLQETFGDNGNLVKQIFDSTREGTPLYQLRVELARQISDLQQQVASTAGAEQIAMKTTIRGLRFEEQVERLLERILKHRKGDILEPTTTTTGRVTRSKKGDFMIRFGERPDAPLVIETKDEARLTLPQIQRILKEAMENRGGAYAILVSKSIEALPGSVGWFNEYGDNQLVVALGESESDGLREEILSIALNWARLKILLQTARKGVLDISKIESSIERAGVILG